MQTIKQLYRSNYSGESVVTQLTLESGEWNPTTETVPNSVFNSHTTTQAVAIGNGPTRKVFDLSHIANHKAGLGGADRLQSYGCNQLYKEFTPDFLIAVGDENVKDIVDSGYCANNIVYANGDALLSYPGKFYLVPQNVYYDAGSLAAYMACFDGHKKVFLLGYDSYTAQQDHPNQTFFMQTMSTVIKAYSDVDFVRVMPVDTYSVNSEFDRLPNFRQINYRAFVLEADIG